jgi:RNA polymerase sigma factor (sigma-70 family)
MRFSKKYDDEEILRGILKGEGRIVDFLYQEYFPKIFNYIYRNSGSLEDAKDIFQDALLMVYQKLLINDVKTAKSFQQYLFVMCKYLWYKKLDRTKSLQRILHEMSASNQDSIYLDALSEKVERKKLILDHLHLMDERCREIIQLFERGESLMNISEIMNIESYNYVKKIKFKCMKKLMESIKGDRRFNELHNTK